MIWQINLHEVTKIEIVRYTCVRFSPQLGEVDLVTEEQTQEVYSLLLKVQKKVFIKAWFFYQHSPYSANIGVNVKSSEFHAILHGPCFLRPLLLHDKFLFAVKLAENLLVLVPALSILIKAQHLLNHFNLGFGVDCFQGLINTLFSHFALREFGETEFPVHLRLLIPELWISRILVRDICLLLGLFGLHVWFQFRLASVDIFTLECCHFLYPIRTLSPMLPYFVPPRVPLDLM